MIQIGKLCQAHMREVIGTQTKKTPLSGSHRRRKVELMLQIIKFLPELLIVAVLDGIFLQQSCLSKKECFHLKQAVPMLIYCTQRQMTGPYFKSVAIQSETEITGKGDKEHVFPMVIATFQTYGDILSLSFKTLHLQGRQPGMDGQLR